MIKLFSRYFFVEVDGDQYVVKYNKIDEFLCLFLPSVVVVTSTTCSTIEWDHEYQWYKRI